MSSAAPEATIVRLLTERQQTLSTAESCTGGLIAHRITNVPGASVIFFGGFITYSNEAKQQFLGVKPETLVTHGGVSEAVAVQMAEGAREAAGADYAIAVTGIAGPGGGTPEKPVGTVFMAVASPHGTTVQQRLNPGDRLAFKDTTARQALDLLLSVL